MQFDVGCDRARPSIRNSRRGNKSSRKTCELVRCHQLWSVVSRAEILRVIGGRGGDRVTRGIGVQRGDPVPRGFLLNGIKGTGLNLIGLNRFEEKTEGDGNWIRCADQEKFYRNGVDFVNCDWD